MKSDKYLYILGGLLLAASIVARIYSYPVETKDFTDSIVPWMNTLSTHPGLSAFKDPFSDYAPLYLYLLKFLTVLPVPVLYSVKTLSVIFDIIMAFVAVAVVRRAFPEGFGNARSFAVFAVVFSIPTVIVNSSLWAQCDSIYTAFVLLSLLYVLERKPFAASLAFAFAISFKLQAVFFLPVLIGYLIRERNRAAYILVVPAVYALLVIPAVGGGGSLGRLLSVYFHQSGEYQALSLSAPTIFSLINNFQIADGLQTLLSYAGILAAFAAAGFIMVIVVRAMKIEKVYETSGLSSKQIMLIALCSVLVIPFLLPHMHERYFYLADVISVAYFFYDRRRFYVPVGVIIASLLSYVPFLSASIPVLAAAKFNIAFLGALMLLIIISLVPDMAELWKKYAGL